MREHEQLVFNYRFQVLIENESLSFTRISGMGMERRVKILTEGGHSQGGSLDTIASKHPRTLRMESGVYGQDSSKLKNLRPGIILPYGIIIIILGGDGKPSVKYATGQAVVTKWKVSDLDAEQGKILVDTFEIAYNDFSIVNTA